MLERGRAAAFFIWSIAMRINTAPKIIHTHEGAVASHIKPADELRRTVMACLLWESGFYESGEDVAARIKRLVPLCNPHDVADIAIEAREKQRLRHAPLLLVRELARDSKRCADGLVANTLCRVIQRADELAEFLALYWSEGKKPLAKQVKKGLACAFDKFNEYALAKYNRDATVKLRDVLFMVHAKPKDEEQAALWKRLVDGKLAVPDTWEVALSGGANKKESFERLLREGKLGYLALLRNLRNMQQAEVDSALVFEALASGAAQSKALPFRYVAAARAVPAWEPQLDAAMQTAMSGLDKLPGRTVVLVDVSGSMDAKLSEKSDLMRIDAAAALAVLVRGVCQEARVFTFSTALVEVPPRSGMALIDAVIRSQSHAGTYLGGALEALKVQAKVQADRIVVITDEQTADAVGAPIGRGYIINVATNKNGVGYGDWTHINGFSEAVVQYIAASERITP
jgi:60 kDa SS-A/Ro ribonucleoprotein